MPSWAASGDTYARFRLSTIGDLGLGGMAADGEVEDYPLAIVPPVTMPGRFVARKTISSDVIGAYSVFAADLDGDGDMDVLSASKGCCGGKIEWYENDGGGGFTARIISDLRKFSSVFAADVDGDGDIDVLSSSLVWYENDGIENFTAHTIGDRGGGSVFAADMDGDGDIDVLTSSLVWYENDGDEAFTAHTIATDVVQPRGVFAADMDGDGDMDVLGADAFNDKIAWYENDGNQRFTAHTISTDADGAAGVFAADVDGDGDIDVLSASWLDDKIAWYENDGNGVFTAHTISTAADGAWSVFAADVDGDVDVLSASYRDAKIAWYENDGSEGFTTHAISTIAREARSVFAADLDGDGDLDVLSASFLGENIVWYENLPFAGFDHGDAPAPYPTLDSAAGASHLAQGPTLGTLRDVESDGQPTDGADGDGADEDGVTFASVHVGQLSAGVTVNVQNAPQGARLDAWIDFNGNGTWGDPDEQIVDNAPVNNGDNALLFNVPSLAFAGNTYARVRVSTEGDLGVGGLAGDGEVEDYPLTIGPSGADFFGRQEAISSINEGVRGMYAADIDGDGDIDVLSAYATNWPVGLFGEIRWWENDGNAHFTPHTIADPTRGGNSVFAADVDGDGDMDVLSASRYDGTIAWYENDGSQRFTAHTISTDASGAQSVYAADVDGDGDIDVLIAGAAFSLSKIAWYENDGSQRFTAHTISTDVYNAYSVHAADLDGDGDIDVLSASYRDDKIAWYENDGSQRFTAHTISNVARGARSVHATDMDGDGDIDVLSASVFDNTIAWYENNGNARFTAHVITNSAVEARSVFAADLDGDGDIDVLSASNGDNNIAWYENDGSEGFTAHTISTDARRAFSVLAADLDGDDDLDVLSASGSFFSTKIAWYENFSPIVTRPVGDLTGNGFVDFEDLTVLLAAWNQNVSAEEGNLVDPAGTPVNFEDLTVLLAAWTGPGPAASPQPAATQDTPTTESHTATSARLDQLTRRAHTSSRRIDPSTKLSSHDSPLRRLQAAAVDRAMGEELGVTLVRRKSAFVRRRR